MESADTRLAGLTLSWLLTRPQRRGTRKTLEAALWPYVEHRLARSEWKERHASLVMALRDEGLVTEQGRDGLVLSAEGRTRALGFLGLEAPPRGVTWKKLKTTYLQAHSLGLSPSRPTLTWLAEADGVRAALLKRQHALDGKETPSLAQVRDRLLWRQLGVETDQPFRLAAVQAHLLGQMLEMAVSAPGRGVEQLAARAAGAVRVDAEAVRLATLRAWVLPTSEPTSEPAAVPSPPELMAPPPASSEARPSSTPAAAPVSLPGSFAERVLAVARALPLEQRFGPHKVFIAHVWRVLAPEWSSREAFNTALLEANRTRRLSLSRADLVSIMDPTDVAESEVRTSTASFHFVVVESSRGA